MFFVSFFVRITASPTCFLNAPGAAILLPHFAQPPPLLVLHLRGKSLFRQRRPTHTRAHFLLLKELRPCVFGTFRPVASARESCRLVSLSLIQVGAQRKHIFRRFCWLLENSAHRPKIGITPYKQDLSTQNNNKNDNKLNKLKKLKLWQFIKIETVSQSL